MKRTVVAGLVAVLVLATAVNAAAASTVVITGLRWRDGENVKISNYGDRAVKLTGWTLWEKSDHHVYEFPRFRLGAGEHVKISSGSGDDTGRHLYWGLKNVWDNHGDTATLKNANGHTVYKCAYTKDSRFPQLCYF